MSIFNTSGCVLPIIRNNGDREIPMVKYTAYVARIPIFVRPPAVALAGESVRKETAEKSLSYRPPCMNEGKNICMYQSTAQGVRL